MEAVQGRDGGPDLKGSGPRSLLIILDHEERSPLGRGAENVIMEDQVDLDCGAGLDHGAMAGP